MTKPRDWWMADPDGPFPIKQTTVWEKEATDKPVLYGAHGEPLVRPKLPLGFQPPKSEKPR